MDSACLKAPRTPRQSYRNRRGRDSGSRPQFALSICCRASPNRCRTTHSFSSCGCCRPFTPDCVASKRFSNPKLRRSPLRYPSSTHRRAPRRTPPNQTKKRGLIALPWIRICPPAAGQGASDLADLHALQGGASGGGGVGYFATPAGSSLTRNWLARSIGQPLDTA